MPISNQGRPNSGYRTQKNNWIDKKDVLEYMGICQRTLQNWRSKGILPHYPMGGRYYYREGDLEKMLEQNMRTEVKKRKKK